MKQGNSFSDRQRTMLDEDRKSTRLNSSHVEISYAVFCLKKKKKEKVEGVEPEQPGSAMVGVELAQAVRVVARAEVGVVAVRAETARAPSKVRAWPQEGAL